MPTKPEKPDKKPKKDKDLKYWLRVVGRRLAHSPLPAILFISTFILIRWWNNSDFSYLTEIYAPIFLFSALAIIAYYLYRWIMGPGLAPLLASTVLIYLLYVYQFVQNSSIGKFVYGLVPSGIATPFNQSLLLVLIMAALVGLVSWAIAYGVEKVTFLRNLQLYKVLIFTIAFIFAVQVFKTATRYLDIRNENVYNYPAPTYQPDASKPVKSKPDIYYLVFDRYTNQDVLKDNFGFDNSAHIKTMADNGFITRDHAFSNYPFTMSSISSTLAMNYHTQFEKMFKDDSNWQTAYPYRQIFNNPPIAQLLKKDGYTYNQVSSWWDFTRIGIKADRHPTDSFRVRVINQPIWLSDLQRDIVFKSVLSPWLKKGLTLGNYAVVKYDLDRHPRENFNVQMAALKGIAGRSDKVAPQFTFAHILAPHPPYVFNSDGSEPPYDPEANDNGVDEKVKYTNELPYVNYQMEDLVAYIKQKSPDAVVVIQADEGPYPKQFRGPLTINHHYDPLYLPLSDLKQKVGIYATYRMPGVPDSQVKQLNSSVNTFRFILDKYLNYNLPMLPECNFSTGNKFIVYDYASISDKIKGQSDPACNQYE